MPGVLPGKDILRWRKAIHEGRFEDLPKVLRDKVENCQAYKQKFACQDCRTNNFCYNPNNQYLCVLPKREAAEMRDQHLINVIFNEIGKVVRPGRELADVIGDTNTLANDIANRIEAEYDCQLKPEVLAEVLGPREAV